ncbi:Phage integrase, N-terminal SAM-like domain [Amycolatopsis xylanica]|uniref:Phage integrase, N-terminal SAM-like domain n=1 Tax=Amycolatopsis xylanica TaxID=589385 RepID=A0A1H3S4Y1_9PSEU|nr:N-terminal phage integrase SAM-like domain-containing protein [Amycolatopsis xylanica]SDZ32551.1 Phage integrase, N-terminal SAM-like domain [Amycolatopsis xylanica]
MAGQRGAGRKRGNIEERGGALRVRLYAGIDPVTSKQVYLRATIDGTGDKSWRTAEDKLAEFRTQVLKQRSAGSSVTLSYALDEWLRVSELEESTRNSYEGYIARTIVPALGHRPVKKIDARMLESLYTELRRCRVRCDGKPFIEKHKSAVEDHDCKAVGCKAHACRPMAASTVRQIHGHSERHAGHG